MYFFHTIFALSLSLFSFTSHAGISEKINTLFTEYNKRFATGQYVADPFLISQFNIQQDALVTQLKQTNNLQKILFIQNSYDSALTVTLFAITDEQNNLLGLYYDLSKYYDEETRSYLRFNVLTMLSSGLNFVPVNGSYALTVKGFYFQPAMGGTLQFNYLKDLKKKIFETATVFMLKKNDTWLLTNEKSTPVTLAYIQAWTSFFPPNGGVKEFILR